MCCILRDTSAPRLTSRGFCISVVLLVWHARLARDEPGRSVVGGFWSPWALCGCRRCASLNSIATGVALGLAPW
eukprot:5663373-Alexandrium_andersonii.AAC.1